MRLTQHTDFALRVMIYLTLHHGQRVTIQEIAKAYGISRNHLMKVVQRLSALGHVRTVRGKRGGLMLAGPPNRVKVGAIVRGVEDNMALVECFGDGNACRIAEVCRLQGVISAALEAFLRVLDRYSLADIVGNADEIATALQLESPPSESPARTPAAPRVRPPGP